MFRKSLFRLAFTAIYILIFLSVNVFSQEVIQNESSRHIVIEIDGIAEYRDRDWDEGAWQTLSVGLPVQTTWFIHPIGPSEVTILCAGGEKIVTIREETENPDCVDIPPPDIGSMVAEVREGNDDPNVVVILSPIDRIAGTTPIIIWDETRDYTTYRVTILSNGLEIFSTEDTGDVEGTVFQISDPNLLLRGNSYTIRITPITTFNDIRFGLRDTAEIFVLSDDEYGVVNNIRQNVYIKTVQEVDSADIVTYAEAWTLYEYALFSEATSNLSQIITLSDSSILGDPARLRNSPYPYILIGDSLQGTGYPDRAQAYYARALNLAKTIEDRGVTILILNRLIELQDDTTRACYLEDVEALSQSLQNPNTDLDLSTIGNC